MGYVGEMRFAQLVALAAVLLVSAVAVAQVCVARSYSGYAYNSKTGNAVRCYVQRVALPSGATWNCSGSRCTRSDNASVWYDAITLSTGSARVRSASGSPRMTASGDVASLSTVDFDGASGTCKVWYAPRVCGPFGCSGGEAGGLESCGTQR